MIAENLSHYKLIKKIGAGGMGEVWLAEDTKLSRKVALKVLPEEVARDRRRLSRFLQEARLAANLNHPNIATIYEVSGDSERPFIAMELVEGETLADRINSGELSSNEILEIAVQIADALDEAHRQGVMHRDIKAANIIINRRGHAKVLDFGLAKTTEATDDVSGEAETQAKTEAGMLVGTVPYMSPEHALGKRLDGRTDLWSFGVLLYEMTCGALPFRGATQAAVFDAILHQNPQMPHELNGKISPELEMIILKLLQKDREFRYQTASDLRADLRRLQHYTSEFIKFDKIPRRGSAENLSLAETGFIKTMTGRMEPGETANTAFQPGKSDRWKNLLLAALLVGLLGLGAFALYRNFALRASGATFERTDSRRLTALGAVSDAAISPDGKYVAYVHDEGDLKSLWLKQITTGSLIPVVPPAPVNFQGIAFSPDGSWIYYNIWDRKSVGEIFRVATLGGTPQKIVRDCMPSVIVSPDSREIGFVRSDDKTEKMLFIIYNTETRQEKILWARGKGELVSGSAAWSPDGKSIAFVYNRINEDGTRTLWITEHSIADGSEKTIWTAPAKLSNDGGFVWKPDKSGLIVSLAESQSPYNQIWLVDYKTGEARQLTRDFNSYRSLSISADGTKIASLMMDYTAGIWLVNAEKPNETQKLPGGKIDGIGVAFTPDGRIVHSSIISGNLDVWIADASGANRKQLTNSDSADIHPCVSADGRRIFFLSDRDGGNQNIWQMNLDGSDQKKLVNGGFQWDVICPKRDAAVYFTGVVNEKFGFWKLPFGAAEPVFIRDKTFYRMGVSNDGKRLAFPLWNPERQILGREIFEIETEKSKPFDLPSSAVGEQMGNEATVRWSADDRALTFINQEKGVSNVWQYAVADGKLTKLTDFDEYTVFTYDTSFDGKRLAVTRFSIAGDAVLISDVK
jgi:eukaryotic-like serine/threonine-protein kinase